MSRPVDPRSPSDGAFRVRPRSLILALVIAAAVGLCGYLYYAPYLALHRLQLAARTGDADALSEAVDFPALRANIKLQLDAKVQDSFVRKGGGPLAALASSLAHSFTDPMVEMLVTPHAIAMMANGAKLLPQRWSALPPPSDAPAVTPSAPAVGSMGTAASTEKPRYMARYVGLNRFEASPSVDGAAPQPPTLVFAREGMAWRLVAIDLGTTP